MQVRGGGERPLTKDLYEARKNLRPSGNPFLDACLSYGMFPTAVARFCTKELKIRPTRHYFKDILDKEGLDCENVAGVRADESLKRSKLPETELFMKSASTGAECWTVRPILQWSAQDCFNYLKEKGVKPNPLYLEGMSRVGCMPCIFAKKGDIRLIADRFPDQILRLQMWEEQVSKVSRNGKAAFFWKNGEAAGIQKIVQWVRSGCDTPNFFDDDLCCKSYYGLCE